MPTFTAIALETLLESRVTDSYKKPLESNQCSSKPVDNNAEEDKKRKDIRTPHHIYIQPALYVTPEQTPIPDTSSESVSPSPYVVNNRRRVCEGGSVSRRVEGYEIRAEKTKHEVEDVVKDNFLAEVNGEGNVYFDVEDDDFLDTQRKSLSVGSYADFSDFGNQVDNQSLISTQAEFFDADEDFSSDGSSSSVRSFGQNIQSELRTARLVLLDEISKRKSAEDAVTVMYSQWQRIHNSLSNAGLTFPAPPNDSSGMLLETNSIEQFTQKVVSKFIAESIAKGQARAKAELAAETIIELKDQEISRLRDKMQYYEAVNHEMSQRNLEIIESVRRQRQRKKNQRRWLWSGVGIALAIGASGIAFLYLPQISEHHPSPFSTVSSDASCNC